MTKSNLGNSTPARKKNFMIKSIALILFILVLGKFAEAAGFNFQNAIDVSNDIESNLVNENMVQENTELPDYRSYFNFIDTFADYIHSEVLRFVTIIGEFVEGPSITETPIAQAIPLSTSVSAIPRISNTIILPSGPIPVSAITRISNTINLPSGSITVSEALALIPVLQGHFEVLKSAWTVQTINKNVVAALKMRSLIPDYIIADEEDPDELAIRELSRSFDGVEDAIKDINFIKLFLRISVKKINAVNFNSVLDGSFISILNNLPNESKAYVIDLIKNNSHSQESLAEIINNKEAEIEQAMANSIDSIRHLQAIFRSTSQVPINTSNTAILTVVYYATKDIDVKYNQLRALQLRESEPRDSETRAILGIVSTVYSYEVALSIQKLAEILEVI